MSLTIKDCMPCSLESDICHPYIKDVISVMADVAKEARAHGMHIEEAEQLFSESSSLLRRGWTFALAMDKPFAIVTRMFDVVRVDIISMKEGQFMFASTKQPSSLAIEICDELERCSLFVTCSEYNKKWAREDMLMNMMMKNFGIYE